MPAKRIDMGAKGAIEGFTLMEIMVTVSISAIIMVAILQSMVGIQDTLSYESNMDKVEGGATMLIDRLGRDLRESSYVYVFAGDWYASKGATVDIDVTRNYLSSNPVLGGAALVPGITNEGWTQCSNPSCSWDNTIGLNGSEPIEPNAFLGYIIRNNGQSTTPTVPPPSLQFSALDSRGRLFSHLDSTDSCPFCGTTLSSNAFFSGVMFFSPRADDGTFSYVTGGNEVQWQSMVFYCPFRTNNQNSEIRRYVFYASQVNANATLADLLDFDGNGVIESPPMTDDLGDFVLDAEGETFGLSAMGGGNALVYTRWDAAAGRSFTIQINRTSGVANVTVIGGPYGGGGTLTLSLDNSRFAGGVSDFDVSTYINNPSWESGGVTINPTGVSELGVVRVTLQVDRSDSSDPNQLEAVQSTMIRPRN